MVPLSEEAKLKKQKKNNGNIPPPNKVSGGASLSLFLNWISTSQANKFSRLIKMLE